MANEITWCKICRQVVSVKPAPEQTDRYDGLCVGCKRKQAAKPKKEETVE